jgi:hypothetical protein
MGKRKRHPAKNAKAKSFQEDRVWKKIRSRLSASGWVQNITIAFVGTIALLVAAMWTHTQIKNAAIAFAVTGTAAVWIIARLVISSSSEQEVPKDAIRLKFVASMPSNPAQPQFAVRYTTPHGDTLSPLPLAIAITLTNTRPFPSTLDEIHIEFQQGGSEWTKLQSIPINHLRVYWVFDGLDKARLVDFSTNGIESLLNSKPLAPGIPVSGWLFFEMPTEEIEHTGNQARLRMLAKDTEGNVYDAISPPLTIGDFGGNTRITPNLPFISVPGPIENLTGLRFRLWHGPI